MSHLSKTPKWISLNQQEDGCSCVRVKQLQNIASGAQIQFFQKSQKEKKMESLHFEPP